MRDRRPILTFILLLILTLLVLIAILPSIGYRPSTRYLGQGELWAAQHLTPLGELAQYASVIEVRGELAYVVGGQAPLQDEGRARGLTIWAVADPAAPAVVGFLDGFFGYDLAVKEGFVFIASGGELVVVDARDGVRPVIAAVIPAEGLFELFQTGRELYLLTATGIQLYDVAEPAEPRLVDTIPGLVAWDGAAVADIRLFLTDDALVYLMPDREGRLFEWGRLTLQAAPGDSSLVSIDNELAAAGSLVVATGRGGWHLFDFGPATPQYLGFYTDDVRAPAGLALDYPLLWLADGANGVVAFDLSERDRPVRVAYDHEPFATNVAVAGDVVWASSRAVAPVQILLARVDRAYLSD
ncbi:MAG: hypothetical protein KDE28_20775 [Anaerolineales bacterium]|nr:hypothetical protein [Anaerolineales bacterium]